MSWRTLFSTPLIESWAEIRTDNETPIDAEFVEDYDWQAWVAEHFPHVAQSPFGSRHIRLWSWFEAIKPGSKPLPRVEVWPRGGAKSTTAEMGVAYIGTKLSRRYCLYVCETQDQADKHVGNIAKFMEDSGMERDIGKYGNSKGWRRNQLRSANGFNVESLGLDTAARGIKLDEFRPDLIIFDDIDNREDTEKATEKKERAIKDSIIPAGSSDCAVLFIQNLILEDGVVAKLSDDRAKFLLARDVPQIEPAVWNLTTELYDRGDGNMMYRITSGEPTWEGQSLETCEAQINEWGLDSFLRESQHEVQAADGEFFKVGNIRYCGGEQDELQMPARFVSLARGWDFAGTAGGGDYTVGTLEGADEADVKHKIDQVRGQWSTEDVQSTVIQTALDDREKYGAVIVVIPQDPGQAGKFQAALIVKQLKELGIRVIVRPTSGRKALRARDYQKDFNSGNVVYHRGEWNKADIEEHRRFREDETHTYDDCVDSSADAHYGLRRRGVHVGSG